VLAQYGKLKAVIAELVDTLPLPATVDVTYLLPDKSKTFAASVVPVAAVKLSVAIVVLAA
jgi:hypothetical protein